MELSIFLADIIGLSLIIISLSLLLYPRNIKIMFDSQENDKDMFFTGIISLVLGIYIILVHNVWIRDWQIIITVLGWAILVKGIFRLFLPDSVRNITKKMEKSQWISPLLVGLVILGCVLIYFGFTS